jgi:hypothetical protein
MFEERIDNAEVVRREDSALPRHNEVTHIADSTSVTVDVFRYDGSTHDAVLALKIAGAQLTCSLMGW